MIRKVFYVNGVKFYLDMDEDGWIEVKFANGFPFTAKDHQDEARALGFPTEPPFIQETNIPDSQVVVE